MDETYPFVNHPCWTNERSNLFERIHLPIAPLCNVKCAFCDHNVGASCHLPKPGRAAQPMSFEEALAVVRRELTNRPNLRIVAIAGPGEPLANVDTFRIIEALQEQANSLSFCLSTNGVLLRDYSIKLRQLHVDTVTVSMSTSNPTTAALIYEWAFIDGKKITGVEMAKEIIDRQVQGIKKAIDQGIHVKVNTILIPRINAHEMESLAANLSRIGVELQNIVPLVPNSQMAKEKPPSRTELRTARMLSSHHLRQFTHCAQCRSDVVGIPGSDTILTKVDQDSQPRRAC